MTAAWREAREATARVHGDAASIDAAAFPAWEALADGTIDLISTDHAPHTREEKERGWTDGWKAHTGTQIGRAHV